MIKKLRRRFVATTMSLATFVLVATLICACVFASHTLREKYYAAMRATLTSERFSGWVLGGGRGGDGDIALRTAIVQVDAAGNILAVSLDGVSINNNRALTALVAQCLSDGNDRGTVQDGAFRFLVVRDNMGARVIFADRAGEISSMKSFVGGALLLGACGTVVLFFVSLYLARRAVRPIESSWNQQRRFVADASHELKTPLTVIQANADILRTHGGETVESQSRWVDCIDDEAHRMGALVGDMLLLARADDEEQPASPLVPLNFTDLTLAAALPFEAVAYEGGRGLVCDAAPDIWVAGDAATLPRLVGALLDNACKYARGEGDIVLSLAAEGGQARLTVSNPGPPIAPEHLPHLFERFYRPDAARAPGAGAGLGLSIVQAIAARHKGEATVKSDAAGTAFTVTLPLCGR